MKITIPGLDKQKDFIKKMKQLEKEGDPKKIKEALKDQFEKKGKQDGKRKV